MGRAVRVPGVQHGFTGHILQIARGRGRQPWRVRLISRNRQIRLLSEGYPTRAHAVRAARGLAAARTLPWTVVG